MPVPAHSARAMVRAGLVAVALALAGVQGATAQEDVPPQSSVLTIDQERLFQSTLMGQRMQRELNAARSELIAENSRIQEELEAEEAELTERRASMEPAAFRALADAFDEKVNRIRAEQEAKTRRLQRKQERDKQAFAAAIVGVVREVVEERGASVILDKRAILLAASDVDVTDEVRARVDEILGDGGNIAAPLEDQEEPATAPFSTGTPVEDGTESE